ncbi:hypothetical protein TPHA_0C04870 [Tetrapisispora phaffii CBS 4417]|uniref:Uncharacterized protein n=1 Tax=Tetrapisispora phaffii (strain ATCC 24235 / CBS 4417 / NBRC 1672 / NRRL Y-8282 / UCD 70-5) TaxID=1071381 RepID=G8BQX3_TETPH|nr:hypothetical protein TPHA_0C04870 [Tetrapisispora phaffii CBS 4417]CCE62635.1 hypothetical protein TPHA_0C04870 [Tetrapisispora phaffii CBS 4417]
MVFKSFKSKVNIRRLSQSYTSTPNAAPFLNHHGAATDVFFFNSNQHLNDNNHDNNDSQSNNKNDSNTYNGNDNLKYSNRNSKNSGKNYNINNSSKFIVPLLLTSTATTTNNNSATTTAATATPRRNSHLTSQNTTVAVASPSSIKSTDFPQNKHMKYLRQTNLVVKRRQKYLLSSNLKNNILRFHNNNYTTIPTTNTLIGNSIINYNNLNGQFSLKDYKKNQHYKKKAFYSTKTNYSNDNISNDELFKNNNNNNITNDVDNNGKHPLQENHDNEQNIEDNWPWEENESYLNKETFLDSHSQKIKENFNNENYEIILPLYQSIKRNDCIPSLETYYQIIFSIINRKFDSNDINYKMYQILSIYEDIIIKHKMKPTEDIYNLILQSLFTSSIKLKNTKNGLDFYRIAIEIFLQIHSKYNLSNDLVIKNLLIATNCYPNVDSKLMNTEKLINTINSIPTFSIEQNYKFYYNSLINYSILKNDLYSFNKLSTDYELLIEDFTTKRNNNLITDDYQIWSLIILGNILIKGDINYATQIFETKLNEISSLTSNKNEIFQLVKNFILSVSIVNPNHGYELLSTFKSNISWFPDFDYYFYLRLLNYSLKDWDLTKKYYNSLYALPLPEKVEKSDIFNDNYIFDNKTLLSDDMDINENCIHDFLIAQAFQCSDSEMIQNLIHESIVKKFKFNDLKTYEVVFEIFKGNKNIYSDDFIKSFIELHGDLIKEEYFKERNLISNDMEHEEMFHTHNLTILDSFVNLILQKKIYGETNETSIFTSKFFKSYCNLSNIFNVYTLTNLKICINHINKDLLTNSYDYSSILDFYSKMILKINRVDLLLNIHGNLNEGNGIENNKNSNDILKINFDPLLLNSFNEFKVQVHDEFKEFMNKYKDLHFEPSLLSSSVSQAIKLFDFSTDIDHYFTGNLGDWDKSYPISLGPVIRKSEHTGIREFNQLYKNGYKFDFETYRALFSSKNLSTFLTKDMVINAVKTCMAEHQVLELKNLIKLMVHNLNLDSIRSLILKDKDILSDNLINNLNNTSLMKLIKSHTEQQDYLNNNNTSMEEFNNFLTDIKFPHNFATIKAQTTFFESISMIYMTLYKQHQFDKIIEFNKVSPVQNLYLLLFSYLKTNDLSSFKENYRLYKSKLSEEDSVMLLATYYNSLSKTDEAIETIQNFVQKNNLETIPSKLNDIYSNALFNLKFINPSKAAKLIQSVKITNEYQLSNILSYYSNDFPSMMLHFENFRSKHFNISKQNVLEIILQSYCSILSKSTKLSKNSKDLNHFDLYIENYFKFKCYLMDSHLTTNEINKIIDIWYHVKPSALSSLVNNIMESIHLDPERNTLYILNDFSFTFRPTELRSLINQIKMYYVKEQKNGEQKLPLLTKIDNSLNFINDTYKLEGIVI